MEPVPGRARAPLLACVGGAVEVFDDNLNEVGLESIHGHE